MIRPPLSRPSATKHRTLLIILLAYNKTTSAAKNSIAITFLFKNVCSHNCDCENNILNGTAGGTIESKIIRDVKLVAIFRLIKIDILIVGEKQEKHKKQKCFSLVSVSRFVLTQTSCFVVITAKNGRERSSIK